MLLHYLVFLFCWCVYGFCSEFSLPEDGLKFNSDYDTFEDIPIEKLQDSTTVFLLQKSKSNLKHKFAHNSKSPKKKDIWIETKNKKPNTIIGQPISFGILETEEGEGTIIGGSSEKFKWKTTHDWSFGPTIYYITLGASLEHTRERSITLNSQAECQVPKYSYGGLFLFIEYEVYRDIKYREWKVNNYPFGAKYNLGPWQTKKVTKIPAINTNPVYVCSLDKDYVDELERKSIESGSQYADYAELLERSF